jgi:phosphatidylinositol alpha-1,6-mannosyltransferase
MIDKLLLITEEYPPQIGGVASYLQQLHQGYSGEFEVIAPNLGEVTASSAVRRMNFGQKFPPQPQWLGLLWYLLRSFRSYRKSTIVAGQVLRSGVVGAIFSTLFRRPFAVFAHGQDVLIVRRSLVRKFIARWTYRRAGVVLCNSTYTRGLVIQLAGQKVRTAIIHPSLTEVPVETTVSDRQKARGELGIKSDEVIVFVGRLVKRKGVHLLLEAAAAIRAQVPDVVVYIVGDGPEREALIRRTKELALEEHVVFAGQLDEAGKHLVYQAASVFCTPQTPPEPYDVEGFGIVFLEAAAHGLPCVGGNNGGVVDAVEHDRTGFLINPIDPHQLQEVLVKLLLDKGLAGQMGAEGRERVLRAFDPDGQRTLYFQELNEL